MTVSVIKKWRADSMFFVCQMIFGILNFGGRVSAERGRAGVARSEKNVF